MPLSRQSIDDLRRIIGDLSREEISEDEAWEMATRLLSFFDALTGVEGSAVDNPRLTNSDRRGSM